ncbi:WD40 repeat [Trinorchestia longiramus]|nr:WD40 repeat [Trinorchestia longiramus]
MAEGGEIIDINTATVKDLETLFGVGRAKAEAIFSTRMVKGPFCSLEELLSVPGIGRNVLDQNKGVLVCEAPSVPSAQDDDEESLDESSRSSSRSCSTSTPLKSLRSPPLSGSYTPLLSCKSTPQSRRSSRRSSQIQEVSSAVIAGGSNTSSASTGSVSSGSRGSARWGASSSRAVASAKSNSAVLQTVHTHVRTRHRIDSDTSEDLVDRKTVQESPTIDDGAMDWMQFAGDSCDNRIENNRLGSIEATGNCHIGRNNRCNKSPNNGSSCSGYLIGDELGEAELNKLRVRENSNGVDDLLVKQDYDFNEDSSMIDANINENSMQETHEEIAAVLRHTGPSGSVASSAAVLGSDTPFEESMDHHGARSLSPNTIDIERLTSAAGAQVGIVDSSLSKGVIREPDQIDGSAVSVHNASTGVKNCVGLFQTRKHHLRRRASDNTNGVLELGGNDVVNGGVPSVVVSSAGISGPSSSTPARAKASLDQSCRPARSDNHSDSAMDLSNSPSIMCFPHEELDQSEEEDDLDEETDEDLLDDDEEEVDDEDDLMIVESTSNSPNKKKQGKRKFDTGGELRLLLPVKKSCKADNAGLSLANTSITSTSSGSSSSVIRRSAPSGLASWLGQFHGWTASERICALDSLIDVCDLGQVRHVHQIILPMFQRDFISLLPKELALYVLSFLSPRDLLKAAMTCKYWNMLTADNLLWREKCKEAGIDNFLDHMDKRRRKGTSVSSLSPYKSIFMRRHNIECNWRVNPLRPPRVLKGHDDHVITCLQFSGNTIVSGSDDNTLKVWNATTSKCMRTLTGHTGGVWSSQMRDNIIVSGSTDRMLRVWDAETGHCTQTLYGHTSTVRCLHLHNNIVVSGSRDATLRVWDVTSGMCNHVLVGHVAAVRCVQYNGRLVVSGAYDFMVKVWNPETEECLHTLQGHTNRVYSLQFDGVHVVSGSLDTTIRVWDVESGTCRHTLMGHQSLTSGMELHNNILISGNADSTVKVWDIVTGQCLQTLSGSNKHRSAVTCLQFINTFVVTSSDDGTVKLWDVSTGEFVRNLVTLDTGNSGGVVWRIRASETKLVCAVGSRNGTEETKLLVLDFDAEDS